MSTWRRAAFVAAVTLPLCLGLASPAARAASAGVAGAAATTLPLERARAAALSDDVLASATPDAKYAIQWALQSGDAGGRPFAVVDKTGARMFVFDGAGRLVGQTPVLTGLARGDGSVPGIGQRPVDQIRPFERTTPAGRFVTQPGRNLHGEAVVWVDYDTGIAIHRLRPGASEARRARSLASATPDDNRQSYGCVVVPPAFMDSVVLPVFGRSPGVVYVMPDDRPVQAMFGPPQGGGPIVARATLR